MWGRAVGTQRYGDWVRLVDLAPGCPIIPDETILGSSMVEPSAVNRKVAGSSPARGAALLAECLGHARLSLTHRRRRRNIALDPIDGCRDFRNADPLIGSSPDRPPPRGSRQANTTSQYSDCQPRVESGTRSEGLTRSLTPSACPPAFRHTLASRIREKGIRRRHVGRIAMDIQGMCPPVTTPFTADGEIDEATFREDIRIIVEAPARIALA